MKVLWTVTWVLMSGVLLVTYVVTSLQRGGQLAPGVDISGYWISVGVVFGILAVFWAGVGAGWYLRDERGGASVRTRR